MTDEKETQNGNKEEDRELYAFRAELDPAKVAQIDKYLTRGLRLEYLYATSGLLVGWASVVLGAILVLRGAVGATSWSARVLQLQMELNDAGPGVIIAAIGLFVIYVTRPDIVLRRPTRKLIGITDSDFRKMMKEEAKRYDEAARKWEREHRHDDRKGDD